VRIRGLVRIDAVAALGTLPALAPGVDLVVGLGIGRARIEVGGRYLAPQRKPLSPTPDSPGGEFQLAAGALSGCYAVVDRRAFAIDACVRAEVGALVGAGYNVAQSIVGAGPWLAFGGGAAGVWRPVRWLGVRAEVGAVIPVFRPGYVLQGVSTTPVHQAGLITGQGTIGAEVYF
jgi:hypothetical protein